MRKLIGRLKIFRKNKNMYEDEEEEKDEFKMGDGDEDMDDLNDIIPDLMDLDEEDPDKDH